MFVRHQTAPADCFFCAYADEFSGANDAAWTPGSRSPPKPLICSNSASPNSGLMPARAKPSNKRLR